MFCEENQSNLYFLLPFFNICGIFSTLRGLYLMFVVVLGPRYHEVNTAPSSLPRHHHIDSYLHHMAGKCNGKKDPYHDPSRMSYPCETYRSIPRFNVVCTY